MPMPGRMSNRDRIAHLRAEADAAAKEKAAAKAEKAAAKARQPAASGSRKAAAPAPKRVRIAWLVCDASGKEVQQFPYAQEQQAREAAQQLTTSSGRTHFVRQGDVPVE